MKIRAFRFFVPIFILFFVVGTATAAPMLDFGIGAPTGGSISYAGGAAPLVGVDIDVDTVVGLATPSNSNVVYNLISATLSFTTGASLAPWVWGGGSNSSIQLYGGVDLDGNGSIGTGDISAGTLLLSGQFGFADVSYYGNEFHITGASFTDEKNSDLLNHYGLPLVDYSGHFNISFSASYGKVGDAFTSSSLLSGDVTNTPVPIPGAVWLLGSGLAGLVGIRRKFKK